MLRIIYMGTPQFAVTPLQALIQGAAPAKVLAQGYELVTVITRPDKAVGRGQEIVLSPLKQAALAHGIPVWQPGSFKRVENIEALAAYHADLYIVAAFGQILPQAVLAQPRYGTLNIHASLLPKYRGISPISEAILQGDAETGVTIMLLDAGVDTGPILLQESVAISKDETTGSLTARLADLGAQALLEALPRWVAGQLKPQPQTEELASHTKMLRKEDGEINWQLPAAVLARKVRAYTPWPGTYSHWRGKLIKILSASALALEADPAVAPGTVRVGNEAGHKTLAIGTGAGYLVVKQVHLEGKKAMSVEEFLRGHPQIAGEVLQ